MSTAESTTGSQAAVILTAPGTLPDDAPPVHFDRLSVERRVLGSINEGLHSDELGPRNTLPAIADFLLNDPNVTSPPPPNQALEVAGLPLDEQVRLVLNALELLIADGLVVRSGDIGDSAATYHLTPAGVTELQT